MLNLVLHVTNLIVGIFFLNTAFSVLRRSFSVRRSRKRRALDLLLFSLSFMTGIVPIVSPGLLMNGYAFAAGTFSSTARRISSMRCTGTDRPDSVT